MSDKKRRVAEFMMILRTVAGAREYALAFAAGVMVFAALLAATAYIMTHAVNIGAYGAQQLGRDFTVILFIWFLLSLAMAVVAVRISLHIAERVAGPVKRMERLLDRLLEHQDVVIVLREKDALANIADKINRIMEKYGHHEKH